MMNKKETWYFISKASLQTTLLIQSLEKSLDIVILKVPFTELLESLSKQSTEQINLIIIDLDHFHHVDLARYLLVTEEFKITTKEIIINSETTFVIDQFIKLPNLVGVFSKNDTIDIMSKGLDKVINGELWLSRKLTSSLIEKHRKEIIFTSGIIADLTHREEQIMKLLTLGASNGQIAEQLFVSENTVKTHLHNVFKKIKVNNRIQAVMWAQGQQFKRVQ